MSRMLKPSERGEATADRRRATGIATARCASGIRSTRKRENPFLAMVLGFGTIALSTALLFSIFLEHQGVRAGKGCSN
jgi:hypothetical protein